MTTTPLPTPVYTQADLDADINGIDVDLEDIGIRVNRIRAGWPDVQHLHPGVDVFDYIRQNVPRLAKNTAAAVALVESKATSVSDARRLTGRSRTTIGKALSVQKVDSSPKPTTVATGKTAPGPKVGTKRPAKTIAAQVAAAVPPKPAKVAPAPVIQPQNLHAFNVAFNQLVTRFVADATDAGVDWSLTAANKAVVKAFTDEVEVAAGKLTLNP